MSWLSQQSIAALDLGIKLTGESVTLQRLTTNAAGVQSVALTLTCRAGGVRANRPQSLEGADGAPDSDLVFSPTGLAGWAGGIPVKDDRVLVQGREQNIQTVSPIYVDGVLVRVNCQFAE